MNLNDKIRLTLEWAVIVGASALTGVVVVLGPEVSAGVLSALIGVWIAFKIARVVILSNFARYAYLRRASPQAAA